MLLCRSSFHELYDWDNQEYNIYAITRSGSPPLCAHMPSITLVLLEYSKQVLLFSSLKDSTGIIRTLLIGKAIQ